MRINSWIIIGILFSLLVSISFVDTNEESSVTAILRMEMNYSNPNHQSMDGFCDQNFQDSWCDTYFKICITSFESSITCNLMNLETKVFADMSYVKFMGPKAFTINFNSEAPKKISIRVEAIDSDRFTAHDHIATFERKNFELPPSTMTTMFNAGLQKIDNGKHNWHVKISAALKLDCTPGHYGEYCSRSCFPERSPRTQACHPNGTYICVPGFLGDECEKPDACFYKPCVANATCVNTDNRLGFECICNGVNDPMCYANFNPCVPSPCEHDGQCIRTGVNHEKHSCKCPSRWTGENCSIPISPCELAQQKLTMAYLGDLFERPTLQESREDAAKDTNATGSKSLISVCKNGGVCVDRIDEFKFSCNCTSGWKGELCDVADWKNYIITGAVSGGLVLLILLSVIPCSIRICERRRKRREMYINPPGFVYLHTTQKSSNPDTSLYATINYAEMSLPSEESPRTVPYPSEYEYSNDGYSRIKEMVTFGPNRKVKSNITAADDDDDVVGPPPPERPATFNPIPMRDSYLSARSHPSRYTSFCSNTTQVTSISPQNTVDETFSTLPKRVPRGSSTGCQWFP